MKATEYIAALQDLVDKHGDLYVVDARDEQLPVPEYGEGDDSLQQAEAFVVDA